MKLRRAPARTAKDYSGSEKTQTSRRRLTSSETSGLPAIYEYLGK
jgi:hypothetical protein